MRCFALLRQKLVEKDAQKAGEAQAPMQLTQRGGDKEGL